MTEVAKATVTGRKRSRESSVPVDAGFAIRLGDMAVPVYWLPSYPVIAFSLADFPAEIGAAADQLPDPRYRQVNADGYVSTLALTLMAPPDLAEQAGRLHSVVQAAFHQATVWALAEELAKERQLYADGLRLCDMFPEQRNRILAAKYPDFDPRRDDLHVAVGERLRARRKKYGFTPEHQAVERQLGDFGFITHEET